MSALCEFCEKFGPERRSQKWYDKELTTQGDFCVVPGVGALTEGYLLIVPRHHYRAMANLPKQALLVLENLKNDVIDVAARVFSPPVLFEHGSVSESTRAGGCIDHAHLHVLPCAVDVTPVLTSRFECTRLQELTELEAFARCNTSYIFFENQRHEMFAFVPPTSLPSQFMRRVIAEALGQPERWDYAVFPNYAKITSAIEKLCPWPNSNR